MTKDAPTAESARDRFEAIARKLGCDESEAAFDDKLRQIAKAKVIQEQPATEKVEKPK